MATQYDHVINDLRGRLSVRQSLLQENDSYYNAEQRLTSIGVATPPEMRSLLVAVGWPRIYVDAIEQRMDVEGFRLAGKSGSDNQLWEWWQANDMDVEAGIGHTEALIHGIAYCSVSAPDPTNPLMDPTVPLYRVESPFDMIADVDPVSRKVKSALRLTGQIAQTARDNTGTLSLEPVTATLLLPDRTVVVDLDSQGRSSQRMEIPHGLGVVPVVPIVNRPRARAHARAGQSEILKELRSITDAACRLLMNMSAVAELMAVPQRLLFGVAQEALTANPNDPGSVLEAYMARIIAIEDSEAHAFQWVAAELQNFVNALSELSKHAVAYTGLPQSYLGNATDNPVSAEALKASEERIVKLAERKSTLFGSAWEQVNRLGMLVMGQEIPSEAFRLETMWRDPSTPTYAAKADGVTKMYNAGNGLIPKEQARIDMGYSEEARRQMREWDQESPIQQLATLYKVPDAPSLREGAPGQVA